MPRHEQIRAASKPAPKAELPTEPVGTDEQVRALRDLDRLAAIRAAAKAKALADYDAGIRKPPLTYRLIVPTPGANRFPPVPRRNAKG